MGRRKRHIPPFEVEIERLGKKGIGIGTAPDGAPVWVKPAPPGARLLVMPQGRRKGKWQARRLSMVEPPPDAVEPPCSLFGLCGGCTLQEMSLRSQREAKEAYALREVAMPRGLAVEELKEKLVVHSVRGAPEAYAYRNKIEMSFGTRRYLSDEAFQAGESIGGRFLGFHAPGRFDRVADTERCWLVSESLNRCVATLRETVLTDTSPMPWDAREHTGFWRHAMLRQGVATGECLIVLFTAPTEDETQVAAVERVVHALQTTPLEEGHTLVGVVWVENDRVADVAQGEVRKVWGQEHFEECLGDVRFQLSYRSFFQTSTNAAVVLYDTIDEALGEAKGTLMDLYCGVGSIGLYLADGFEKIVGVEEVPAAIENAKENAKRNGVEGTEYRAAKVEEVLEMLPTKGSELAFVVDPPRAGLHPKVAKALANASADVLVYVACHPGSLGRDQLLLEEGGWKLTELWTVDLFPQTGHIEMVGRFVRDPNFVPPLSEEGEENHRADKDTI